MILIDTSVWIAAFRNKNDENTKTLNDLLSNGEACLAIPIVMEILSGCSSKDQNIVRTKLSALPIHYPSLDTWGTIEKWIYKASSKGRRFGLADLLIAAIAYENSAKLWSFDRDFTEMRRLGFIELTNEGT